MLDFASALAAGRARPAEEVAGQGAAEAEAGPFENPLYQLRFARVGAELAAARGRLAEAENLLERARRLAQELENRSSSPSPTGPPGRSWRARGVSPKPRDAWRRARETFEALGNAWQAGLTARLSTRQRSPPPRAASPRRVGPPLPGHRIGRPATLTIFDVDLASPARRGPGVATVADDDAARPGRGERPNRRWW